jgi:hypothetical protein
MPGTWDSNAERDLVIAAWASANGDALNLKADWNKTHEQMREWGYSFTKEAITYVVMPYLSPCAPYIATQLLISSHIPVSAGLRKSTKTSRIAASQLRACIILNPSCNIKVKRPMGMKTQQALLLLRHRQRSAREPLLPPLVVDRLPRCPRLRKMLRRTLIRPPTEVFSEMMSRRVSSRRTVRRPR